MAVTKIANVHSNQVAIVSVVLTFVCFVVGEMTMMYLPIYEMGIGIGGLGIINLIVISVKSLFFGDLFTIIIAVLGLFIAYEVAK